MNFRERIN